MTNEELDKWFDDLSYEDKCAAIFCLGDNTYSIKELKEMYDTPEDMLEDTYGRRTFEPNHWYDDGLKDKQEVYDNFKEEKENDAIATNTPPKKTRTELKEACIAAFEKAVKNPIKGTIYGEDDYLVKVEFNSLEEKEYAYDTIDEDEDAYNYIFEKKGLHFHTSKDGWDIKEPLTILCYCEKIRKRKGKE